MLEFMSITSADFDEDPDWTMERLKFQKKLRHFAKRLYASFQYNPDDIVRIYDWKEISAYPNRAMKLLEDALNAILEGEQNTELRIDVYSLDGEIYVEGTLLK